MTKFHFDDLNIYQENIALAGEHFSGKTLFAAENIVQPLLQTQKVKIWIWDHHAKIKRVFEKLGLSDLIAYYLDDLQYGTQCYVPESKSEEHFNEFCKLVQKQNNLHVVYDELHNFMSAQRMAKELQPIIRDLPANQGVTYTAIWQRVSEGHKAVMSNARHKFLFAFDELDQDRYLRIFGSKADLFLNPENRKYFTECSKCEKSIHNGVHRILDPKFHEFNPRYPKLSQFSFLYKDDKHRTDLQVFDGGSK